MWKTKDPNPFHYPPLWLKLKCSKKCHFKLKQNLSLCLPHLLCLFLSLPLSLSFFFVRETQGPLRDVFLIQEFLGGHISKPAELTGCWLEVCPVWRLCCRALQKIFLQDKLPAHLHYCIISYILFWPTLSPGYKSRPSSRGGEKEGRCVSSPWCSPVFRRIEKNCKETRLHKQKEKEIIWIISLNKKHTSMLMCRTLKIKVSRLWFFSILYVTLSV